MVNEAVRMTLAEDADDLRDVDRRQAEESSDFEEFVASSRNSGRFTLPRGCPALANKLLCFTVQEKKVPIKPNSPCWSQGIRFHQRRCLEVRGF
jgi:hypothetical protein